MIPSVLMNLDFAASPITLVFDTSVTKTWNAGTFGRTWFTRVLSRTWKALTRSNTWTAR